MDRIEVSMFQQMTGAYVSHIGSDYYYYYSAFQRAVGLNTSSFLGIITSFFFN